MITTVIGGSVLFGKLIFTGVGIGIGFWLAKKLTSRIDEYLLLRDPRFQQQCRDMGLITGG